MEGQLPVFLSRLSVSSRFLLVLAIGFAVQACISVQSLINLRQELMADRATEVKHLDETAYSTVAFYYDRASKGLMSDAAAREAAKNAVRAMRFDGTNYYFIWDQNGTGVAHGSNPQFEGVSFIDSPDAARLPYVADMVGKLVAVGRSSGEGFTSYRMTKPGQTMPLDKIAYNRLFKPWGWNIGTGAYVDDIDAAFWAEARKDLIIAVCLIALAGLGSFILARDLSLALHRLSRRVERVAAGDLDGEIPDVGRGDEVGVMARALLVLRDTSALATALESRVNERTRQLRDAQEELVRKERLSTLGQLTATVAHELRNPLSAIRNTMFALRETVSGAGLDFDRPLSRVDRNIQRCDRIITDLLDFTRVRTLKPIVLEADYWLEEVLNEQHLPDGIVLRRNFGAGGRRISFDPERLQRVVINLIENAVQAMADSAAEERRITVSTGASAALYELVIEDNGPGIPDEALDKVFEPLFSTKSFGTGLGLPTVKQIVELHGGTVEIVSRPGAGTRVVVRLPHEVTEQQAA
jgi:signal transduction histidine kinase